MSGVEGRSGMSPLGWPVLVQRVVRARWYSRTVEATHGDVKTVGRSSRRWGEGDR